MGTTAIISNTWFDGDGNVIRTQAGGTQEWTETLYDGLGDPVNTYDGVGGGSDYSDFANNLGQINVNSDQTVLDSAADEDDDAGDQRLDRLQPLAGRNGHGHSADHSDAQVTYTADWVDGVGRRVAEADFGTNNGTAMTAATCQARRRRGAPLITNGKTRPARP